MTGYGYLLAILIMAFLVAIIICCWTKKVQPPPIDDSDVSEARAELNHNLAEQRAMSIRLQAIAREVLAESDRLMQKRAGRHGAQKSR